MARIAGVDLPRDKRLDIGLTYVYGIGPAKALETCGGSGVSPMTRVRDLTDEEVVRIRDWIGNNYNVEGDLSCLLYTSPSPRDRTRSRMPSSA